MSAGSIREFPTNPRSRALLLLLLSPMLGAGAFLSDDAVRSSPGHAPRPAHAHAQDAHAGHDMHEGSAQSTEPAEAPAVRWATDAALREGMARIRTTVANLDHEGNQAASADAIDAAVRYLFENCRLPAKPDQALHGLLSRLLQSSARLREGVDREEAVHELHAVLLEYPLLFDDASWAPIGTDVAH